jgi:hypothetical protein
MSMPLVPGSSPDPFEPAPDQSVESAVRRLGAEFRGRLRPQLVVGVVRDCRRELGGSPADALPELVERLARYRLARQVS